MSFDIKDYPTFLSEIKKRPQMWCGGQERSATLLSTFLNGFRYSEHFHKIPESERLGGFDWDHFEKWVQKNYNPKGLSYDSFSLAVFQSKEELKAFDLWFSWYEIYVQQLRGQL